MFAQCYIEIEKDIDIDIEKEKELYSEEEEDYNSSSEKNILFFCILGRTIFGEYAIIGVLRLSFKPLIPKYLFDTDIYLC